MAKTLNSLMYGRVMAGLQTAMVFPGDAYAQGICKGMEQIAIILASLPKDHPFFDLEVDAETLAKIDARNEKDLNQAIGRLLDQYLPDTKDGLLTPQDEADLAKLLGSVEPEDEAA